MAEFEQSPDFMVPASTGDVENMALIHALRATSDGLKRLGAQQDRMATKIDTVHECMHDIDKRLAVIEGNSLNSTVSDLEERVVKLENQEQRRLGAIGLWEWGTKSWPAVLAFMTLVVYVVLSQTGML